MTNETEFDHIDLGIILRALRTRALRSDITEMERFKIRIAIEKTEKAIDNHPANR